MSRRGSSGLNRNSISFLLGSKWIGNISLGCTTSDGCPSPRRHHSLYPAHSPITSAGNISPELGPAQATICRIIEWIARVRPWPGELRCWCRKLAHPLHLRLSWFIGSCVVIVCPSAGAGFDGVQVGSWDKASNGKVCAEEFLPVSTETNSLFFN